MKTPDSPSVTSTRVWPNGDTLTPATRRAIKSGAEDVLDRLTGLL